jgi:tetratricopeptide (TPR) repeat protein
MKFTIKALALVLAASSAPALAQYGYSLPQTPPAPPAAPAAPAAPATPGVTNVRPSAKALKALTELQNAIVARDTAAIPAKLAAAKAVASTKEDRYLVARFQLNAATMTNDLASASEAIRAIEASGVVPASEIAALYAGLGGSYYKAKQLDQAVAAYERQRALDPNDMEALGAIADIRAEQGRQAEAVAMLQQAIQASVARGAKPDENLYRRAVSLAYKAKLPSAPEIARQWLSAYPSPNSWRNSLAIFRNLNSGQIRNIVDVLRLARLAGTMEEGDYQLYGVKTFEDSNFGEAKAIIDEGIASGKIKPGDAVAAEILAGVKGKVPTEADLAASEKTAAIPNAFIRVGDRYYGAGNYQKAAELYRTALTKGADANLANLRLGEALARSGDKAGAIAALKAVSGPNAEIAKFWLLYVERAS